MHTSHLRCNVPRRQRWRRCLPPRLVFHTGQNHTAGRPSQGSAYLKSVTINAVSAVVCIMFGHHMFEKGSDVTQCASRTWTHGVDLKPYRAGLANACPGVPFVLPGLKPNHQQNRVQPLYAGLETCFGWGKTTRVDSKKYVSNLDVVCKPF